MSDPQLQQPAWQPPAVRPPLGQRHRAGAALAGAIGFLLLSLGFTLFGVPIAVLLFGALFSTIIGVVSMVLNLAAAAVVGWLSWWWMAHLMRPATPASSAP